MLEADLSLRNELCVKAVPSLKAELRAHILGSRFSGLPDTEAECVPGIYLPPGLWVVTSYAPCDCSEIVTEVVRPVSSELEKTQDQEATSLGVQDVVLSSFYSHLWPLATGARPFSSPSLACQELYRSRSLRKGLCLTVLTCEKQAQRSPDAVSHMDGKGLS